MIKAIVLEASESIVFEVRIHHCVAVVFLNYNVINVIPAGKNTVAFAVELASMISSSLVILLPSPLQKTSRVSVALWTILV
jgi:hypothetical protein